MGFRRNKGKQVEEKAQSVKGKTTSSASKGKSSNFIRIGTIMSTKDGEKVFMSLINPEEDQHAKFQSLILVDNEGNDRVVTGMYSSTIEESLQRLVKSGHLTEEEAEERLKKCPETVLAEVSFIVD